MGAEEELETTSESTYHVLDSISVPPKTAMGEAIVGVWWEIGEVWCKGTGRNRGS